MTVHYLSRLVDITVDWEVYNVLPCDKQLVDLIVAVGRSFPINDDSQSPDDCDDVISNDVMREQCDLVKVMIDIHEGIAASHPITIDPKQTVSDAGIRNVKVAF